MKQATCEDRVSEALESTLEDLRLLWSAYRNAGQECETCDGYGEIYKDCSECEGTGFELTGDDCPTCAREGEIASECSACNGNGTLDEDGYTEDLGNMYEYGLCFDYVAPNTFDDQPEGWFRYQLSTGGPGDEFRIFAQKVDDYHFSVYRVEYWFLDWFDGASRTLHGSDRELLDEIFESFFVDSGTANAKLTEAMG